uniref:NodB homology domain-containing protein n=1 Tax=Spongospora subterranea TaxID=70186 RepID=A0A0H5R7E4_9EUKA|eukprot:CRZ09736.1 hypothetical protein [Spongospora subterranea]
MAVEQYNTEPSYSVESYDSNATAASGPGFCWKQFCCALICLILLIAAAAMVYIVVDGNQDVAAHDAKESKTPANKAGQGAPASGKQGTVKSFNWCGGHKKKVVLTFDDGPSVVATPNVLVDLDAIGAKGTFFVTPAVDGEPDTAKCAMVEKVLEQGSQIKLHSYKHDDFMGMVDVAVIDDMKKTHDWATKCAGAQKDKLNVNMFRPPYGSLDYTRAQFISNELGYTIATWNLDTEDFRGGNATFLMDRIKEKYAQLIPDNESSVMMLMHDKTYVPGGSFGLLPMVKKFFDAKGYEFITADQCYEGCDPNLNYCKMEGVWPGVFEQP